MCTTLLYNVVYSVQYYIIHHTTYCKLYHTITYWYDYEFKCFVHIWWFFVHIYPVIDICRLCRHKNIIFSFGINQSTIISYITAPKVVTSHQGCSVLSSAWWWPPLERLPNCQPSHWTPSWPLNQAPHVDKVDISSPNQESPIFFLKKPPRFNWS